MATRYVKVKVQTATLLPFLTLASALNLLTRASQQWTLIQTGATTAQPSTAPARSPRVWTAGAPRTGTAGTCQTCRTTTCTRGHGATRGGAGSCTDTTSRRTRRSMDPAAWATKMTGSTSWSGCATATRRPHMWPCPSTRAGTSRPPLTCASRIPIPRSFITRRAGSRTTSASRTRRMTASRIIPGSGL